MPFLAEKPGSKIALLPADVGDKFGPRDELNCPYCQDVVTYRNEGINEETGKRVFRAHFWHSKKSGGSNQTGGCEYAGESPEHEQMKILIGDNLRQKYDVPEYSVEKSIGCKKADVAINSPNNRLEGIAVEYQHKNESKDYIETTQEYLEHGYGVYWVFNTEDGYDMMFTAKDEFTAHYGTAPYFGEKNKTNSPPLRLGGMVDPWPYAVPDQEEWNGEQRTARMHLGELVVSRQRTEAALGKSTSNVVLLPRAVIPAKLPREFFDALAQEIKRDYGWENMFSPPTDHTDIWCYSKVPATLPPEWHEEKAREFWQNEPWYNRFNTQLSCPLGLYKFSKSKNPVEGEIPLLKWVVEQPENGYYKSRLMAAHEMAANIDDVEPITVHCVDCRTIVQSMVVTGGSTNMVSYSTIEFCQNCDEEKWHTATLA